MEDSEYDILCLARGDENKSWKDYLLETAKDRILINQAIEKKGQTFIEGDLKIGDNTVITND